MKLCFPNFPKVQRVDLETKAVLGVVVPLRALKKRALSLGTANAFDYAMQFLLPVVLARCLDPVAFGQYRLMWLAVMTIMAVAPLAMPHSLYYFLPRSGVAAKRLYVHQTLFYLVCAGLVGGWVISPWNPLLPSGMHALAQYQLVPCLMTLWVASCLLDLLPTIEERVSWQVRVIMSLSLLRALVLAAGAYLTGDLRVLILLLVAFALLKLLLLLGYIAKAHGLNGPWLERHAFVAQLRYAAPFGLSSGLYALRSQADQWVAAGLFAIGSFAAFTIAAVLAPMVNLFRLSVNHAFLPSMSRLEAAGDIHGMLKLNSHANVIVGALVYPLLAFAFVFAEELVTVIYTGVYIEAAQVMRVYIISLAAFVVEVVSIMLLLKEGPFALRLNLLVIVLSIGLSWLAAQRFGLPGAAVGSVVAIYVDRIVTLKRIAVRTGIPFLRLQDWRTLGLLLLFSALSAALAWAINGHFFMSSGTIVRLSVGAIVVAAAYGMLPMLFGLGRGWLAATLSPES